MAKRWARLEGSLENSVVFEFIDFDPAGLFHPSLIFVEAPADAVVGSRYAAGAWTPPPPLPEPEITGEPGPAGPPPVIYRTEMTPIRFKAQFSVSTQVAIKRARNYVDGTDTNAAADADKAFVRDALDVLFGSIDDPRLAVVDVADPAVIGGLDFCTVYGFLTPEEAATIKLGLPAV